MNSWKGPLCLHFAGLGNSARIAPTPYGGVMRSIGTVFLLVLWSDVPASAQPAGEAHKIDYETAPLERRLLAERCLGGIVVDGSLGEADWQSAPVATNFIQSEPREGAPACAFYLFIRVMEITDILSQNVPLEDVQYLAGHSNPSGHTDL